MSFSPKVLENREYITQTDFSSVFFYEDRGIWNADIILQSWKKSLFVIHLL